MRLVRVLNGSVKVCGQAAMTAGIYGIVHHYRLNRKLRDFGLDVDPVKSTPIAVAQETAN